MPPAAFEEASSAVFEDDPRDEGESEVSEPELPDDADDVLEPVEPDVPVVSAKAVAGIDPIAAPTPSAIASAPTRPTYRA